MPESEKLGLWLIADSISYSNGSNIDIWNDESELNLDAIQSNPSYQPRFFTSEETINNHGIIKFDTDYLSIGNRLNIDSIRTFFIVAKQNSFVNYPWFVSKGFNVDGSFAFSTNANTTNTRLYIDGYTQTTTFEANTNWSLYTISITADSVYFYSASKLYGFYKHNRDLTGSNAYDFLIGNNQQFPTYFDGEIAEIIIYRTSIGRTKEIQVENYLKNKYSPQVNLGLNININYGFSDTSLIAYQPWFVSYTWSTGSNDSVLTVTESGTYDVNVVDNFGYTSSDTIEVNYLVNPLQLSDTTLCLGDTLTWSPDLTGPYNYFWSTGENTPQIKIADAGDYWVEIQDTAGNPWFSDTITISIDNYAQEVSLGNDTTLCIGNLVYLQEGLEETQSYLWSTGETTDYLLLNGAGTYSVQTTNARGCVAYDTINLAINGTAPSPNFSIDYVCHQDITTYTDASLPADGSSITSWTWDFGDGEEDTQQNTSHVYANPGNYQVSLSIGTDNGCNNTLIKFVDIYELPVAAFALDGLCSEAPLILNDQSTSTNGSINQWDWTFPDGSHGNTPNVEHTFSGSGTQNVQLVVATDLNCKDTLIQPLEIKQGPIVDFTYSAACDQSPVSFINQSVGMLDLPLAYTWTFEPGQYSTQQNPEYTFSATGEYTVELFVRQNANNCVNSISKTLNVVPAPEAEFLNRSACVENTIVLDDASTTPNGNITQWFWEVENLSTRMEKNATVEFASPGTYNTRLVVTDAAGCIDSVEHPILVHPLPEPMFEANPNKGAIPLNVQFENQSTGANHMFWQFGNGDTSDDFNPYYTYVDSGTYVAKLIATNEFGCKDSLETSIKGIVPLVDVTCFDTRAEVRNGYLWVSSYIRNQGTVDLPTVNIYYRTSNGQVIKENIEMGLYSGETRYHEFSTQYQVKAHQEITHVCAYGDAGLYLDEIPENDESCFAFDGAFQANQPFPNPSSEVLNCEFVLPFDGEVAVHLYNLYGKLTHVLYEGSAQEGYNHLKFDVSALSSGVYVYRITFEGNVRSYQLFVE